MGSAESVGIDLVCSMLRGGDEGSADVAQDTLFVFPHLDVETTRDKMRATWCYRADALVVVIAKDDALMEEVPAVLEGAYSPVALSKVRKNDRKRVRRNAVYAVYNYYNLELEGDVIEDIIEAMYYRVE